MPPTDSTGGSDIIRKLLQLIDTYCGIGAEIRDSILDLARWMYETKQCPQDEICRKIKHILKEKIDQRKISERWIEDCLPKEYKRRYNKSEVSSLSSSGGLLSIIETQRGEPYSEKESDIDDSKVIPNNGTNELSHEEIKEYVGVLERSLDASEISKNPLEFTIPRKKYENLIAAMKDSNNAIYAIFRDGIFQYAYPDKAQI